MRRAVGWYGEAGGTLLCYRWIVALKRRYGGTRSTTLGAAWADDGHRPLGRRYSGSVAVCCAGASVLLRVFSRSLLYLPLYYIDRYYKSLAIIYPLR